MDFISLFTQLLSEKSNTSPNTVKNYRADLHHFIKWFEKRKKTTYSPEKVTQDTLQEYKATSKLAHSSLKRRIAALKKFHALLSDHNYSHNPFTATRGKEKTPAVDLEDIQNFLHTSTNSPITRKNYLSDIRTFSAWAKKVTHVTSVKDILTPHLIEEYKLRLRMLNTPPSTINRRLSSIRKIHEYAQAANLIITPPYQSSKVTATPEPKKLSLEELERLNSKESELSKLPPVRLFQRLLSPYFELEDYIATKIALRLKKNPKKSETKFNTKPKGFITDPTKMTIEDSTRHFYTPISAPKSATQLQQLFHHAQNTRPKWYKIYHTFTASHYLHFSFLILATLLAALSIYRYGIGELFTSGSVLGISTPPKILAFQGTLTNEQDIAVTQPSTVHFAIYTSETGDANIWQESQLVTPDNTGTFTAYLGTQAPLNSQIFSQNSQLYLGVRLEGQEELRPRQRLANVAYASNSEFLQGLPPITQAGAGSRNVVLALDSSGNLTIPGGGTHSFTSQGGNLRLSGQSVILTSNASSNGNIVLSPNGTGKVDIQNSITNNSQNGALWPGAVTIEDQAVISATTSASPLFSLVQGGTGNIFTASSSGNTRFVIDNAGRVGINTDNPTEYLQINNGSIFLQGGGGRIYGNTLKVESTGTSPLLIQPPGSSTGNIGIGTTSPTAFTHIQGGTSSTPLLKLDYTGSGQLVLDAQKSGTSLFALSDSGNIGLGTTSPSAKIHLASSTSASGGIRFGDVNLYRSATDTLSTDNSFSIAGDLTVEGNTTLNFNESATTNGVCHSGANSDTTATDRDLVVCSSTPADIAEWYAADNTVEAGYIVQLSGQSLTYDSEGADPSTGQVHPLGKQNISVLSRATQLDKVLGAVSTAPYQTIGSDIKKALDNNPNYKAVPLALTGRVLLKIAHNSPQIEAGDPLTLSQSASGKATKATSPTFIVARALEDWDHDKDQILVYIQPTWYQPLTLNSDGSTHTDTQQQANLITRDEMVSNIIRGAQIFANRVEAGTILAKKITVQNTLKASDIITTRLKAGTIEASKITTEALAVTSGNLSIAGESIEKYIKRLVDQAVSDEVKKFQNTASSSTDLDSQDVITQDTLSDNSASNSGTLDVENYVANEIEGLEEKISSISASQNIASSSPGQNHEPPATSYPPVEKDSNGLALLPSHKSTFAIFEQDLSVYGTSTLTEATVLDNLTVGSGSTRLTIGAGSLNSLDTLEIQPFAQAPISFMGGKVTLDTQGNMTIGGDTHVSGTLAARDAIFKDGLLTTQVQTGIISPLPEHDLAFRLGEKEDGTSQKLQVRTATGAAVLSVDNQGNIEASGSGTFSKLNFWDPPQAYAEISDLEVDTQGSAGKAAIKEGRRELTINNENVTQKSLIYITPASNSQNKVVYLLRQIPGASFTVGITTPASEDIEFNWLIVN